MTPARSTTVETLLAHRDWVRALARRLVLDQNQADDLEQQTWLAALRSPPSDASAPRAWLGTVLRNLVRERHRREGRRARREEVAAKSEALPSTDDVVAEAEAHGDVVRTVLALPEPQRTTVLLRFFQGLPPREIAERMGVPVETVRSRTRRALSELRSRLDEGHGGDGRAWCLALLPLTDLVGPPSVAAAAATGSTGAAMTFLSAKSITLIGVSALGVGMTFWAVNATSAPDPGRAVRPQHAVEPEPQPEPEQPDEPVAPAEPEVTPPVEPPAPPPVEDPPPEEKTIATEPVRPVAVDVPGVGPDTAPPRIEPVPGTADEVPARVPVVPMVPAAAQKQWDKTVDKAVAQFVKLSKWLTAKKLPWTANVHLRRVFDFAPDHEETRAYFGYAKAAGRWEWNDAQRAVFRTDFLDIADPRGKAALKRIYGAELNVAKLFMKIGKSLARDAATAQVEGDPDAAAGLTGLSRRAYWKVLLLDAEGKALDKLRLEAHKALGHAKFAGRYVTPVQQHYLRVRSALNETAKRAMATNPKTTKVNPEGHFVLAGLEGGAAKSEHFVVDTVHGPKVAARLVQNAERAATYVAAQYGFPDVVADNLGLKRIVRVGDKKQLRRLLESADWDEKRIARYIEFFGGLDLLGDGTVRTSLGGPGIDGDDNVMSVVALRSAMAARRVATSDVGHANPGLEDWLFQSLCYETTRRCLGTHLTVYGAFGKYGKGFQPRPGEDQWIGLARRMVEMDDDVSLEHLFRMKLENQEFRGPQTVKGYAFVTYLLESDVRKARAFIWHALAQGTPAAAMRVYGTEILGKDRVPETIEDLASAEDKRSLPPVYLELFRKLDERYAEWLRAAW